MNVAARTRQLHDEAAAATRRATASADTGIESARMKQELAATREYLQSVIEQQEAANEELQSANEEVQSANEELQSINEELETSKEEIQSANEELATVNDELQHRNQELSQSTNDLANLIASGELAIIMLSADLRIRRFTPAAEKLFKLIPSDIGRALSDLNLHVVIDDLETLLRSVIENGEPYDGEIQDRRGRWYLMRLRPYRTPGDQTEGVVVVVLDIDQRKRSEQALQESESRFELLANNAPVLIWMSDRSGYHFVNRAFEEFVGQSENEIRGTEVTGFVHPDDRGTFETIYRDAEKEHSRFEVRHRFRGADGEYRWTKTVGIPRVGGEGERLGFVGGTFDITDMKEAEAALLELDRRKNEFLAILAHELRNPLAGIRNSSRLLSVAYDESVHARAREIIDRQTAQMVRMIDDLLEVSRVTQGKIRVRPQRIRLDEVIRQSIETTETDRKERNQDLEVALPEAAAWVDGDATRLEQVFVNLLHNATKFTPDRGTVWLSLAREESADDGDGIAVVRVRDNGIGIESSALDSIFDLFVQGDRRMARARAGLGIGLTLAKRLIEMHGGTIEVHSAGAGKGSEFIVRLPLKSPPSAEAPPKVKDSAEVRRTPARQTSQRRVLIIDDDADAADALSLLLKHAGHDVAVAEDGERGLDGAARFMPEVVLVDIGLPTMDGYDVVRELRRRPDTATALMIAVTGYGTESDVRKSHEAGFDDHLTKPVNLDVLLARLHDLG